ncbi:MAG TPA: hypothetical protein VK605_04910 [Solirubrobacteraceae bacterium]|nr:hypothetical protein [Solirubrobacteraceae bacterium]
MASLLELTSQGDVGTISDESQLSSVKLMTPQELYELWERQNWQSHTIDFEQDRADWGDLDDELREKHGLEPVLVLRRRGARHDAVLGAGDVL